MIQVSPHFGLDELVRTGTGLPNAPDAAVVVALTCLARELLEPVRHLLGAPLRVTSGYRSPEVNARVSGSAKSQHMLGEAADVVPVGLDAPAAMAIIADAVRSTGLPVDQAILYPSARVPFLHVSYRRDGPNRGMLLVSQSAGGHGGPYTPWP